MRCLRLQKQQKFNDIIAQTKRPISDVQVNSKTGIYDDQVKEVIDVSNDNKYTNSSLSRTVHDIYALNRFSKVDMYYEVLEDKSNRLTIDTVEKPWEYSFIYRSVIRKGGIGQCHHAAQFGYLMTQINALGGEL